MEEEYEYGNEEMALAESDAFSNVGQGLQGRSKLQLVEYWQQAIDNIERIGDNQEGGQSSQDCFKTTALPLARIKKVMKTDSEVKMISAEAPILFAKGCDIFITELTMRAWIHAEESKRRTLQRSDIATALQKSDMFDFLIDIVPREEAQPRRYPEHGQGDEFTPTGGDSSELSQSRPPSRHIQDEKEHETDSRPPSAAAPVVADGPPVATTTPATTSAGTDNSTPPAPAAASGQGFQSPYQLQEFDDAKLERQYDEFEYQSYEQVDV